MKRFLADMILVCILVSIGTYVVHKDDSTTQERVQKKVDTFEDEIAQEKVIKVKKSSATLNDIEENRAGKLAAKSSALVVGIIRGSVETFSQVFEGILK